MRLGALLAAPVHLLWPARCAACDAYVPEEALFCGDCALSVNDLVGACRGCALPPRGPRALAALCPTCRRVPFPFEEATVPYEYGEAVADAIVRMKHAARRDIARRLSRLLVQPMAQALVRGGFQPDDVVVPVPLHPRRLRRRGFNQALELARGALAELARHPGAGLDAIPRLERQLLVRVRDTRELGRSGPGARLAEVAGAFAVPQPASLQARRVLLVDDVFTTGATFSECAATLLRARAREVHVLALARAV